MRGWLVLLALAACKHDGDRGTSGTASVPEPVGDFPADATIGKISLYQAVETALYPGVVQTDWKPPVVIGRDAEVRVFVAPDPSYDGRELTSVLTVRSDGKPDVELRATLGLDGRSVDDDLGSTFDFRVPADQITDSTELGVELHEADVGGPGGGDPAAASWDSATDIKGGLPRGVTDDLTVVVLPVVYNADGSGRTPDLSQPQLDAFRDAMMQVYPARSVTIRVGDPLPWDQKISAFNGGQWQDLLDEVSAIRGDAVESANTYYFGMFDSAESFDAYCQVGCILGLSELATNTSIPALRASIGIGFPEYAASTMVHEVGHAHGRMHSPCGGAAGADPNYPYPKALIGSWGYDLQSDTLQDPSVATDIMGYCTPTWISDYTYYGLWQRISTLSTKDEGARSAMPRVTRMRTDGAGHTTLTGTVRVGDPAEGGIPVRVAVFDAAGRSQGEVPGWEYPYDHLPGGMVVLDQVLADGWQARVVDP